MAACAGERPDDSPGYLWCSWRAPDAARALVVAVSPVAAATPDRVGDVVSVMASRSLVRPGSRNVRNLVPGDEDIVSWYARASRRSQRRRRRASPGFDGQIDHSGKRRNRGLPRTRFVRRACNCASRIARRCRIADDDGSPPAVVRRRCPALNEGAVVKCDESPGAWRRHIRADRARSDIRNELEVAAPST